MNKIVPLTIGFGGAALRRRRVSVRSISFVLPGSILMVVIALLLCLSATAQIQQAWIAKYNNGIPEGNHQALKMALDPAGNIYVLGVSANANTNTGYAVVKYAPNGNQLWAGRYDSTNFPAATPTGFALDGSNNVVITGNAVTVKYDANGNLLWVEPYDGRAVAIDPVHSIYITGTSGNFTTMKFADNGSNLWSQTWSYQGLANLSQVIAIDSSTNVYVAGKEGVVWRPFNAVHIGILKYDQNGNPLWAQNTAEGLQDGDVHVVGLALDKSGNVYIEANYLGGGNEVYQIYGYDKSGTLLFDDSNPTDNGYTMSTGLVLDNTGNVLVTGYAPTSFTSGFPFPYFSYATYKYDSTGSNLWGANYPSVSNTTNETTSIAVDRVSNVYVTGYSILTNGGSAISSLKYDPNGNQVWVQLYDGPGLGNDVGNAISVDNSGNVYVAGYETETNGFTSMILIKYSPVAGQKQSNGDFILHAYGSHGEAFDIQASTNLQTWQDLGDVLADTNGIVSFDDSNAPLFPNRFYYTVPQ